MKGILEKLIALKSITGSIPEESVKSLSSLLEEYGFEVTALKTSTGTHLRAQIGEGKTIAFISHYDVVPPGEGWATNPFVPTLKEGKLYGRGSCDMKGGLAAHILAGVHAAKNNKRAILLISADEEREFSGIKLLLEKETDPIDFAVGSEPTANKSAGDTLKIGRRGAYCGWVTLKGVQGHVAYQSPETNINHALAEIFSKLTQPLDDADDIFPASVTQITNIASGTGANNVIPGEVTFSFDMRLSPKTSIEDARARVKSILEKYDYVIKEHTIEGFKTTHKEFIETAVSAVREVTGSEPSLSGAGGMSDAKWAAHNNIPVIEIGTPANALHIVDEFVELSQVELLTKILCKLVERI